MYQFKRLFSLFVAFNIAFASLWAMSPDAIADAIKEDTAVYYNQHDQQQVAQNQNDHEHVTQGQTCNHGCHIAFHLLGFAPASSTNVFAFNESQTVFSHANQLLDSPHLQGPYRPPLTRSLV